MKRKNCKTFFCKTKVQHKYRVHPRNVFPQYGGHIGSHEEIGGAAVC
jgi:hypothetical protein